LCSQGRKILLPIIKGIDFLTGSTLKIHSEPHRPDDNSDKARRNILRDLATLVAG
jgi:hypothetical protein